MSDLTDNLLEASYHNGDLEPLLLAAIERIKELERKLAVARTGLHDMSELIEESTGVFGLGENGDQTLWSELRYGGVLESWLIDFEVALGDMRQDGEG